MFIGLAGEKVFTPGTGIIALLLSMAAIILLQQTNIVHFAFPNIIVQMVWVCMVVFLIRVIGEKIGVPAKFMKRKLKKRYIKKHPRGMFFYV